MDPAVPKIIEVENFYRASQIPALPSIQYSSFFFFFFFKEKANIVSIHKQVSVPKPYQLGNVDKMVTSITQACFKRPLSSQISIRTPTANLMHQPIVRRP